MRKVYLLILVAFTFTINSYVADKVTIGDISDGGSKITHFYPNPATSFHWQKNE
jgi:hypothetical protein